MVDRRTLGFAVAASVLFGGTFVAAKAGLDYFPPLLFVALRFDVAAVALIGYVLVSRSRADLVPRTRGDVAGILATGLVAIGATNALLFAGQQYATSAVGSIVFSLSPILTPVFAALLLSEERVSRRGASGMLLGLLGVALVVNLDPASLLTGGVGKLLLFGGAVAGALGSVLIRRAGGGLSSTVRTAWGLPFGAALAHALSLAAGESMGTIAWAPAAIVALVYVGIFAGAIAYIAYFGLLDSAGPIHANLVFYVVPVVSTLGGWALLGESVSPFALVGFLTIFAGFALLASESVEVGSFVPAVMADRGVTEETPSVRDEPRGFRSD